MIYSVWQPDGGYALYRHEGEVRGIGDDLPDPQLPPAERLGVPSLECGRAVPSRVTFLGHSERAKGVVAPANLAGLSGDDDTSSSLHPALLVAGGAAAGALLVLALRRSG